MKLIPLFILTALAVSPFHVSAESSWYIKPTFGVSMLSDQDGQVTDVLGQTGNVDINLDRGFNAGIAAGYFVNDNWAAELYWEYRSNDSETTLPGGLQFTDGNFASSVIGINAYHYFDSDTDWRWFVGAGLAFTQEIDIDLEDASGERSFSGSGDTGFQLMFGADYTLSKHLSAQAEVRYTNITDIDMDAEENVTIGTFENIDYTPLSLQLSLKYSF
ncbi:porin family protein [Alteromonas gracilis]|uniref:porin family protein n=1 Tax=Alteromonas gracilis TaxID=1479524 RepID=UPI0030CF559C